MALFPLSWLNQPLSENRHVGVINLSYSIITAPGAIKASFSSSSSSQGRVGPSSFNASPAPHHRTADNKRNQKQPNRSCTRSRKSLLRLTMTQKEIETSRLNVPLLLSAIGPFFFSLSIPPALNQLGAFVVISFYSMNKLRAGRYSMNGMKYISSRFFFPDYFVRWCFPSSFRFYTSNRTFAQICSYFLPLCGFLECPLNDLPAK